MIKFVSGDIFKDKSKALVNPVNCKGVMGAGLAKAFKDKYPEMFEEYRIECKKWNVQIGKGHIWKHKRGRPDWILNAPTKDHWRGKSKIEYVESALDWIVEMIEEHEIESISIPALGCGLGGLNYEKVRPIMIEKLEDLDCEILIHGKK